MNEVAAEVEGHDLIGGADELAADEDGRQSAAAAHPLQPLLDLGAVGVVVDLVDARVHPQLLEQYLHCIA